MSIEKDIEMAINSNLTHEVGSRLKNRLDKADADAALVKRLQDDLAQSQSEVKRLLAVQARSESLDTKAAELAKRERALELAEAVLKVKTDLSDARVKDHQDMVRLIFSGPASKLAFELAGTVPVPLGSGEYANAQSVSAYGSVETK